MKTEEIHSYRFKSFTLKPVERQLLDLDQPVSLTPKAFDILTLLILNAGHLVTKEDLMETIWAESFVEEANLARLVHKIRKSLGEDEIENKFIETVPTKGYRFVAEVERVPITQRENWETFAADGPEEFWPHPSGSAEPSDIDRGSAPMSGKRSGSRWLFAGTAIVLVAGLVAAFVIWSKNTGSTFPEGHSISIAVLPLRPISTGERDLTYDVAFAHSVIGDLSRSKTLIVRPFWSMRSYTDLTQDPIAIGRDQVSDYVLESTYLANRRRLEKVTLNLFNVKTGSVDWTDTYKGGDTDLYAGMRNIAARIVPDLLAKLNLAEVVPVNRGTENEEAWKSYLQGIILADKRTVEGAEKGVDAFNNAIRLDPNYAMAYMGLAHALQTILVNGGEREKLCGPALEAEKKALQLDPDSGDAMVMMATNRRYCAWDIAAADTEYRRALDLSPNSAHVRRFYAINIASIEGKFDEALEHLRIAREIEPKSTFTERLVGRVLFIARQYDEAIEQSIKVKDMDPEAEQTSFVFMSYEMKDDLEKAFEWFLVVKELEGENEEALNAWRNVYSESGWQGILRRRLERALEAEKTADNLNKRARLLVEITTLSVQLGDHERAFEYMNKAVDVYVLFGSEYLRNPYLDPIRSDPRYKAILTRTWNRYGGNYGAF